MNETPTQVIDRVNKLRWVALRNLRVQWRNNMEEYLTEKNIEYSEKDGYQKIAALYYNAVLVEVDDLTARLNTAIREELHRERTFA